MPSPLLSRGPRVPPPPQSCGVRSLDGWVPEDGYLRANHNTSASVSSATGQQGTAGTLLLSSTHQHLHRKGLTSIPCTLQPLERIPALAISPVISTSGARGSIKPTSAPGQEWFFLEHAWAQRPPRAPHLIKSKAQTIVYTIPPDQAHLTSRPPVSCYCIPATLTNLFHEHTGLRAFALAASAWNAPPSSGEERNFPTHSIANYTPLPPALPFPASLLPSFFSPEHLSVTLCSFYLLFPPH